MNNKEKGAYFSAAVNTMASILTTIVDAYDRKFVTIESIEAVIYAIGANCGYLRDNNITKMSKDEQQSYIDTIICQSWPKYEEIMNRAIEEKKVKND